MAEPRKPCPFCGGRAEYWPRNSGQDVSSLSVYHEYGCYLVMLLRSSQRLDPDSLAQRVEYFHHEAWDRRPKDYEEKK